MRIQSAAPVLIHTIVDGELFDTEFVSAALRGVTWFANSRSFTENGLEPKRMHADTNMVGNGGHLAAGYSMTVRRVRVVVSAGKSDYEILRKTSLELDLGAEQGVEAIQVEKAMAPRGAELSCAREILPSMAFGVSLRRIPEGLAGRCQVRVSLLGPVRVPGNDDLGVRLAIRHYSRVPHPTEAPRFWLVIHEGCKREFDETWGGKPITRRAWDRLRLMELDEQDPLGRLYRRPDPRRAVWCTRCEKKIAQGDRVVGVEVV